MKWSTLNHKGLKKEKRKPQCRKRRTEQRDHVWVDMSVDELLGPLVVQKDKQQ